MQQVTRSELKIVDWSERVALGASFACLVHCLALPLLFVLMPALSTMLWLPESVHLWVLALAVPTAAFAFWQGWRRHGRIGPLVAGLIGLACLTLGALVFGETNWEMRFTVAGSLVLAYAHLTNWRRRHACC